MQNAEAIEIEIRSPQTSVIRRARVSDGLVTFRPHGSEHGLSVPVEMLGPGARLCVQGAWTPDEKCFQAAEPMPLSTTGEKRR